MTWTQFGEESTRLANFLTGDLDTGQFSLDSIDEIKQASPEGVDYMVFPGQVLWRFNMMGHNYYNDHESHLGRQAASAPWRPGFGLLAALHIL